MAAPTHKPHISTAPAKSAQEEILGQESTLSLLRVYSYYRALLGSLLLFIFHGGLTPNLVGNNAPELFSYTCIVYTAISVWTLLALWRKDFKPSQKQLLAQLCIDVVAITLLVYSSGSNTSGLGYLLIITVAYSGIFLNQQLSLLLASFASLTAIGSGVLDAMRPKGGDSSLFSAGALGVLLFITALLFRYITRRLQTSQAEARSQAAFAQHLQSLAQQVVERMNTGIIAVNKDRHLLLVNNAAYRLLSRPANQPLASLPHDIDAMLDRWESEGAHRQQIYKPEGSSKEIRVSFAALNIDQQSDTLIFLEDNRQLIQQAQQLKLASLGRLTASIAHEVRNPLGAISHAGQLLAEAPNLEAEDKKLTAIIARHSERVNNIIENVLQLSRRQQVQAQTFDITQWVNTFVEELKNGPHNEAKITLVHTQTPLLGTMDTSQLHQVMTNICDNGLRYSQQQTGIAQITLATGTDERFGLPYIDIIDEGPGVSTEQSAQLFEPFNTDSPKGTGLGLYLSKELCDANEASLEYRPTAEGKSCFRICLTHEQRVLN
ncbi:ATP-binding protein [Simiduia sp. 21SJ11W-1]|uniref:sensor histidine kinase n=1 Tax=Simiduia sp. 21SJ11W-1 TaxID=2909669 RepID=UPI00209D2933|nr:ATP-binding protein [Simiduia sp. 21SJ11W-1]UTA47329.1 ATP-binding protein [Simiduia sp. 21SJ11W-1]